MVEAEDAPERFSAERAWPRLQALLDDTGPHPLGSAANALVRERLEAQLSEAGYEPVLQRGRVELWDGAHELVNVMVRWEGSEPGKAVLLTAHYDSVDEGPGASDDGVAVAVLLEIAARLRELGPQRNDVILLFSDGEERGLLGAELFADAHPWFADVGVVVNLEARGTSGPSMMFQTGPHSAWLADQLSSAPRPITSSMSDEAYKRLPNDTDFTVYLERGLTGCNFAYIGSVQHYHTPEDDLAHVSLRSMQHHGDNAWHLLRRFAAADLENLPRGEAVYFDLLGRTVVRWPHAASWGLIAGALALLAFVARRWRRQGQLRYGRAAWAALLLPLSLVLAYGATTGAAALVERGGGWPAAWVQSPWLAACVVWPAAFAALCVLAALAAPWARAGEVCVGLWGSAALCGAALCVGVMGASYLVLVPLWVSLACACAMGRPRAWGVLGTLLGVGAVWLPLEYDLLDGFGWSLAGAVGVRAGCVLLPLLPLLVGSSARARLGFAAMGVLLSALGGGACCLWQLPAS